MNSWRSNSTLILNSLIFKSDFKLKSFFSYSPMLLKIICLGSVVLSQLNLGFSFLKSFKYLIWFCTSFEEFSSKLARFPLVENKRAGNFMWNVVK
nr:hypothetical protein 4 - Neurospora crassa mitochondrion plasmid maranhar [Neurospora crassa]